MATVFSGLGSQKPRKTSVRGYRLNSGIPNETIRQVYVGRVDVAVSKSFKKNVWYRLLSLNVSELDKRFHS